MPLRSNTGTFPPLNSGLALTISKPLIDNDLHYILN